MVRITGLALAFVITGSVASQAQCNAFTPCGGLGRLSRQIDMDMQRQQQLNELRRQTEILRQIQQQQPGSNVQFGRRCAPGQSFC